jgi:hypothetical protein
VSELVDGKKSLCFTLTLQEFVSQLDGALDDECRALRQNPKTFRLSNGVLIDPIHRLWRLVIDRELGAPCGTPGRIEVNERWHRCIIVDVEDQTLLVQLPEEVAGVIEEARFRPDPAYLLDELRKRLTEIVAPGSPRNGEMMMTAMGQRPAPPGPLLDVLNLLGESAARFNVEQRRAIAGALSLIFAAL